MKILKYFGVGVLVAGFSLSVMSAIDWYHPYKGGDKEIYSHNDSVKYESTLPVNPVVKKNGGVNPWSVDYSRDEMRNTTRKFELNRSENHFNLEFPYNHGSSVDVVLRSQNFKLKKGQDKESIKPSEVYLRLTDGQINCSFSGCVAHVKFDNDKVESFSLSRSDDGDNSVVFINNESKFIREVKSHKKMIVELPVWQHGYLQFTYQLNNTEHPIYTSL